MRLRYLVVLLVFGLVLIMPNPMYKEKPNVLPMQHDLPENIHPRNDPVLSNCTQEMGVCLMRDEFVSASLGFNSSLWTRESYGNPTVTWLDGEKLVLNSEPFTYATLVSALEVGPEVIADFKMSFTKGLGYFGVGWADDYHDPQDEWISNFRVCQNGVFIDYWDEDLFLVTYCDGQRVATNVSGVDITKEHQYDLIWSESYVRLCIDGFEYACSSLCIPSGSLPFIMTLSGQHYLVKHDQLVIESVALYTRDVTQLFPVPQILLVWPENSSTVFAFDRVDLEIEGCDYESSFCWDKGTNSSLTSPWDIDVPNEAGAHELAVFSKNSEGNQTSAFYIFSIEPSEQVLQVQSYSRRPTIDGVVSDEEKSYLLMKHAFLRGEDKAVSPFILYVGYFNESLYIAAETYLNDRYHSRISLYVDGGGNGVWGDAEVGEKNSDICISVSAPSADQLYTGIITQYGQLINPVGVEYDSGISENGVSVEYLVPVDDVGGNSSVGLAIGILVSYGGYNAYFPENMFDGVMDELLIIQNTGFASENPLDGRIILFCVSVGSVVGILGYILQTSKPTRKSIEENLEDENLERIRTLLLSHPHITIDRLALLTATEVGEVKSSIDTLVKSDLLENSVTVTDREVIRRVVSSENKQK